MRMRIINSDSRIHHLVNYGERKLFIVFSVLMVALIVDNSFSINADIFRDQIISFWGIALFVAIFAVYAFGQFFILEMVKAKNRKLSGSTRINENVITIIQYALISIIVIIILQILFSSQYHRDLLIASTTISHGAAIFLTSLLAWKLLSWYKIHKMQSLILLFGLTSALIALTSITYLFWSDAVLAMKASVIFPESEVTFDPGYEEGSLLNLLDYVLHGTLTAFVLLLWGGTVVMLYHNFKRIGQVKFWVLVTLPVISFMGILTLIYQELAPTSLAADISTSSNLMIPIWLLYYSGLSMGVIIGLSFILIGRFLNHGIHSRDYVIITGFGFMIFIWAYSAILTQAAYPPYGISTISALPLSLFMILNGLSYSAISVAQDQTLRRSIRKSVKDMKFLESIGTAQMEQDLQKRVLTIAKENSDVMTEETGVQPSLTEDEMKEYLNMVVNEIKHTKHDTM
jgi:hypothetical protein